MSGTLFSWFVMDFHEFYGRFLEILFSKNSEIGHFCPKMALFDLFSAVFRIFPAIPVAYLLHIIGKGSLRSPEHVAIPPRPTF